MVFGGVRIRELPTNMLVGAATADGGRCCEARFTICTNDAAETADLLTNSCSGRSPAGTKNCKATITDSVRQR